ncbi:MAG: hypothetical protein IKX98_02065, partial [Clostridia bacterium]|nr:hypothetical protein [Clostridia bacterium]
MIDHRGAQRGDDIAAEDDVAFDLVNLETDILSENMTTDVWYEILDKFRTEILPKNYKGVI